MGAEMTIKILSDSNLEMALILVTTQPLSKLTTKARRTQRFLRFSCIFSINRGQDLTNFISTLFYTSIIRKICQVPPDIKSPQNTEKIRYRECIRPERMIL